MKAALIATILALSLAPQHIICAEQSATSANSKTDLRTPVCPAADCVPDEKTAVRIAEAVLIPIYGEKHIVGERPFTARLDGNRWIVKGTLPKPRHSGELVFGGTAMAEIDKRDGRIVSVYHMK